MMRLVRVVTCFGIFVAAGISSAQAQTAAEPRWYGEVTAAATLGHKSDSAFGVEGGGRLTKMLDVFAEGGHMGNVGNQDLEERARKVADFIGGTAGSTAYKLNYFDVGVKYRVPYYLKYHPYVAIGFGVASIKPEVAFSVDGADVTGQLDQFGVQLGSDLSESQTRPLFVIGAGAQIDFLKRYFADVTYRYGRTSQGESDGEVVIEGLNTQRVQVGFGIRF
jgi:opacity protein-like surface antigen